MGLNRTLFPTLLAGGVFILAACATAPQPPTDALQAADTALVNAENERAADFAPLEMRTAREKLAAARSNAEHPDELSVVQSRRLADEARADAELASARARLAKADAVNRELEKNSETLRNEVRRGSGV